MRFDSDELSTIAVAPPLSVVESERALRNEVRQLGYDPNSAPDDALVRARDNLFGKRTQAVRDLEWQYEQIETACAVAHALNRGRFVLAQPPRGEDSVAGADAGRQAE